MEKFKVILAQNPEAGLQELERFTQEVPLLALSIAVSPIEHRGNCLISLGYQPREGDDINPVKFTIKTLSNDTGVRDNNMDVLAQRIEATCAVYGEDSICHEIMVDAADCVQIVVMYHAENLRGVGIPFGQPALEEEPAAVGTAVPVDLEEEIDMGGTPFVETETK